MDLAGEEEEEPLLDNIQPTHRKVGDNLEVSEDLLI
jgi:hypothetical protein